jgi:hypothetical protein
VRTLHDLGQMTVIVVIGDKAHCEWLVGTELQQRAFPIRSLRLVAAY